MVKIFKLKSFFIPFDKFMDLNEGGKHMTLLFYKIVSVKKEEVKSTEPNFVKGEGLAMNGKYREAIEPLTETVLVDPCNAWAYFYLGMSYANIGRIQEAIDAYGKIPSLVPDCIQTRINLGNLYFNRGNYRESALAYRDAILAMKRIPNKEAFLIDSRDARTFFYMQATYGYFRPGDVELDINGRPITIKAESIEASFNEAVGFFSNGEYRKAAETYRDIIFVIQRTPEDKLWDLLSRIDIN